MRYLVCIFLLTAGLLVTQSAMASKEGALTWSNFSIKSDGIGASGPIEVTGTQTSEGISKMEIHAFNKVFTLNSDQLSKLHGFSVNGMQLSYDGGLTYYIGSVKYGGPTVYIVLSMGFTSGTELKKLVRVDEQGRIRIDETTKPKN